MIGLVEPSARKEGQGNRIGVEVKRHYPAQRPVGRVGRRGQPRQPEGKSVSRSGLVLAGAAPEQGDDYGRYRNEGSACWHFSLLSDGTAPNRGRKIADGFRNGERPK